MVDGKPPAASVTPASAPTPTSAAIPATTDAREYDAGRPGDAEAAEAIGDAEYDSRFLLAFEESYHADRAAFLRRASKGISYVNALLGTAAVAGALSQWPWVAAAAGFVVTALSLTETHLDLAGSSHKHGAKVEQLKELTSELAGSDGSLSAVRAIDAKRIALASVEAGTFYAVSALAWNTAYLGLSQSRDRNLLFVVPRRACLLRHIFRYTPDRFTSREDAE